LLSGTSGICEPAGGVPVHVSADARCTAGSGSDAPAPEAELDDELVVLLPFDSLEHAAKRKLATTKIVTK